MCMGAHRLRLLRLAPVGTLEAPLHLFQGLLREPCLHPRRILPPLQSKIFLLELQPTVQQLCRTPVELPGGGSRRWLSAMRSCSKAFC
jgi:hypothetical protein